MVTENLDSRFLPLLPACVSVDEYQRPHPSKRRCGRRAGEGPARDGRGALGSPRGRGAPPFPPLPTSLRARGASRKRACGGPRPAREASEENCRPGLAPTGSGLRQPGGTQSSSLTAVGREPVREAQTSLAPSPPLRPRSSLSTGRPSAGGFLRSGDGLAVSPRSPAVG